MSSHNPHHHEHHHGHHHHAEGNLSVAFFLNLSFTIIEIFGGLFTGSVAILSDAIHDLGDTIAIGTAYFLEKKSYKSRDKKYTYGYRRLSPFAALINLVILVSGSVVILFEAIPRFIEPEPVKSDYMILFGVLGLVFNGLAVLRLMKNDNSANTRTVMLHLMEDVLGWAAVLFGAIIIYFTGWIIIDPILSILIAAYILFNAIKNFRSILPIFLQGVPKDTDQEIIIEKLKSIENVTGVHDLHAWTLDGEYNIVTVHLVVSDDLEIEKIIKVKNDARQLLSIQHQEHYTLEIEFESEICEFHDC
jgi:cobalt-zinc-cadmium efflux system protein